LIEAPKKEKFGRIKVKTPLTYYGGKQQLAATILKLIPAHKIYAEPFIGGAAIYFAKEPSPCEVINDTNGELINFYEVLKRDFSALKLDFFSFFFALLFVFAFNNLTRIESSLKTASVLSWTKKVPSMVWKEMKYLPPPAIKYWKNRQAARGFELRRKESIRFGFAPKKV
jgi:hypothetical protein